MLIRTEKEMVDSLISFFVREGYVTKTEVPTLGQSVDLVASKGSKLMLIEAKLNAWKKAIKQCTAHELVADHVCVAIGTVGVSEKCFSEMEKLGYGLIHCSPKNAECQWILKPDVNTKYWKAQRDVFVKTFEGLSG